MIRFFRKLFKRGDFMTRADKAYYKYRAKTFFWSAFCLIIIAWVGTNLVLCALTTNVKSGGDIIYEVSRDVYLPQGKDLHIAIKGGNASDYDHTDQTIKTITFGYEGGEYAAIVEDVTPEIIDVDNKINLYRVNNGADIYILSPNNMIANEDCYFIFGNMDVLTEINFDNFDVSKGNITNMDRMFFGCYRLKEISILSSLNTSSVTNMEGLFASCSEITSLDLRNFDTSNVTNMSGMFCGCDKLNTIQGLSSFETSNVETMASMFDSCESLTSLDLSGWDTWALTDMQYMFYHCSQLETIYVSENFVTTNLFNDPWLNYNEYVFDGCENLRGGKGTTYNENYIDWKYARIDGGPSSATPGYFTAK